MNLAYYGTLEGPKAHVHKKESRGELLLFKSSQYGDDAERALQKSDGTWTYFTADAAYLEDKLSRDFDRLILILGADHTGYKARLQAMCSALNGGCCILDVIFCQLVVFMRDGSPLKMSKRAGNFVSIEQVLELVGKDILRFMMLTRKPEVVMHFDIDQVKEQSKDNPVFYVQYAHARGCSVLANAKLKLSEASTRKSVELADTTLLSHPLELSLIKSLAHFQSQVKSAAINLDPTRLTLYLVDVAGKFHALWNAGKGATDLRFIVEHEEGLTRARLLLVTCTLHVISCGLNLLGVTPVAHM
jgi:arginyl-tRNA synthetase